MTTRQTAWEHRPVLVRCDECEDRHRLTHRPQRHDGTTDCPVCGEQGFSYIDGLYKP